MRMAIDIEGMTCGGCVVAVRNVLGRQRGVGNVEVDVGRVTLELDKAASSEEHLRQVITRAGFTVTAFRPA